MRGDGAGNACNPVICYAHICNAHIAAIRQAIAIAQRIADGVKVGFRRFFDQAQRRALRGGHGVRGISRCCRPVCRTRRIGDAACIQIILANLIIHLARQRCARGQSACGQSVADHHTRGLDLVIVNRNRIGDRDIARIGHGEIIGDDIPNSGHSCGPRRFDEGQGWHLIGVDGFRICRRGERTARRSARCGGNVCDRAGIQISLRDSVGRRTRRRRARGQSRDRAADRGNTVIRDANRCDLDIARIGNVIFVSQRVADSRKGRCRRALINGQAWRLCAVNGCGICRRGQCAARWRAGHTGNVCDRTRIQIVLRDGVIR